MELRFRPSDLEATPAPPALRALFKYGDNKKFVSDFVTGLGKSRLKSIAKPLRVNFDLLEGLPDLELVEFFGVTLLCLANNDVDTLAEAITVNKSSAEYVESAITDILAKSWTSEGCATAGDLWVPLSHACVLAWPSVPECISDTTKLLWNDFFLFI